MKTLTPPRSRAEGSGARGPGRRRAGRGAAPGRGTGAGRPGSPGRKSHGRHSPRSPRLGRWQASLPVFHGHCPSVGWRVLLPRPRPLAALPPLSPCPSLLSRLSLSRVVHTEASGPAHDDQPCSSSSTAGAGNVYLEMDKHLQFKATQRQLLTPPDLTCHLRFFLKFWSRCQPRRAGRTPLPTSRLHLRDPVLRPLRCAPTLGLPRSGTTVT